MTTHSPATNATPAQPRWSSLAVASFALSSLWLCGLGSLLGIVLGHAAVVEIGRDPALSRSRALAWVGLALGYAGAAVAVYGWVVFIAWGRAVGD